MTTRATVLDHVIAANIRFYRARARLTQAALASAVGVTFQQIQKYEKATNRIAASRLFEIAKILSVDVGELFRPEETSNTVGVRKRYRATKTFAKIAGRLRTR